MVTRGVLVDVAAHRGEAALVEDHEITVSELEAALDAQGVSVSEGDALLIRTGHLGRIQAGGDWSHFTEVNDIQPKEPGIGGACLPWLNEHGIAAVACDNWAVEWLTGSLPRSGAPSTTRPATTPGETHSIWVAPTSTSWPVPPRAGE
jgi:kynurenine formamidase